MPLEFNFHPLHKTPVIILWALILFLLQLIDITIIGDIDDYEDDIHLLENDRVSKGLIRYIKPTA
jgi:hypothetical protein